MMRITDRSGMRSVPSRGSVGSMMRITDRSEMRSVPLRGSVGSMMRITDRSGMRSAVPSRGIASGAAVIPLRSVVVHRPDATA